MPTRLPRAVARLGERPVIARLDRIMAKLAQKDETARRLMSIPGFGPITASAMAATIAFAIQRSKTVYREIPAQ
jgi:transposase